MKGQLQNLLWIEELLPPEMCQKNLLGGQAYYLDEKQVLILIETSKTSVYKGITYPFEIWQGCLFPIVPMKQNTVYAKFTFLENHPANKNWLYLPADTEEFEEKVRLVLREIKKRNPLFGIPVKETATEKRVRISKAQDVADEVDTRRPSLFNTAAPAKPTVRRAKAVRANKKSENNLLLSVLKRKRS